LVANLILIILFLLDLKDQQMTEGENVKFTAKISGYPEPDVTFEINGKPVTAS
jgi:hypothetical protein